MDGNTHGKLHGSGTVRLAIKTAWRAYDTFRQGRLHYRRVGENMGNNTYVTVYCMYILFLADKRDRTLSSWYSPTGPQHWSNNAASRVEHAQQSIGTMAALLQKVVEMHSTPCGVYE